MIKRHLWLYVAVYCLVANTVWAAPRWKPVISLDPLANASGWITSASMAVRFIPPVSDSYVKGYSLLLSQSPFIEADLVVDAVQPEWTFHKLEDGIYYLSIHSALQDGKWMKGEVIRLKIDFHPPKSPARIECYDSLFERHNILPDNAQNLVRRPFFKWPVPDAEKGSAIKQYYVIWEQSDGTLLESGLRSQNSFFPAAPVPHSGSYRIRIFSMDEAGFISAEPAVFLFVYS